MAQIPVYAKGNVIVGYATVDDQDASILNQYRWHRHKANGSDSDFYARTSICLNGKRVNLRMHQVLLGRCPSMVTDHINGNKLDNRRENLRVVTKKQNAENQKLTARNKSGIRGVRWRAEHQRWVGQVFQQGKGYHCGHFLSAEEAEAAVIAKRRELGFNTEQYDCARSPSTGASSPSDPS